MKCTLAEAFLILNNKIREVNDLKKELEDIIWNKYKRENGEKILQHDPHGNTVDEVIEKLEKIQKDIRKLQYYIREANYKIKVNFKVDEKEISLYEALLLIKQYRNEYELYKKLGSLKSQNKIVPIDRFSSNAYYEEVLEPTFNTKKYRMKAEKIELLITKIEVAINQANYNNEIDIEEIEMKTLE